MQQAAKTIGSAIFIQVYLKTYAYLYKNMKTLDIMIKLTGLQRVQSKKKTRSNTSDASKFPGVETENYSPSIAPGVLTTR